MVIYVYLPWNIFTAVNIGVLMKLDVSRLPTEAIIEGPGGRISIASIFSGMINPVDDLAHSRLLMESDSFGFAAAKPVTALLNIDWDWDNPYDFTWFVGGWGPRRNACIANAVRKLRPLLRTDTDTLSLRISRPDAFQDVVESVDEAGEFPWGDFPWGGGTFVHVGDLVIPSAVSALFEVEDHATALLGGGLIGSEMLKVLRPEMFGPDS